MEEARHTGFRERNETDRLAVAIAQQRSRIEEFLSAQQKRLDAAGASLAQQIEAAARKISQGKVEADRRREELDQKAQELDRQTEILARFKDEVFARQAEREAVLARSLAQQAALAEQVQRQQDDLDKRLTALAQRQKEIAEAEKAFDERQRAFTVTCQGDEDQRNLVAQQKSRLEEDLARAAAEREELATRRAHTEGQRRRIAQELRAQRVAQMKEIERCRAEVEQAETEQLSRLRDELARAKDQESQLGERLAEQRAASAAEASQGDKTAEDYQRRYEMALDDLRELRERYQSLEQKLAQAAAAPRQPVAAGRLDWETEKGRILAALESQIEGDDEETAHRRSSIEQVIETTERALAEKHEEIVELKRVLAEQSTSLASVAIGAAAVGNILDKDAVILEERENLRRLKEDWHEKFRAAEVELSIERATLARRKVEMDERLRAVGSAEDKASSEHAAPPPKPDRGRWLSHLGLRNTDKE